MRKFLYSVLAVGALATAALAQVVAPSSVTLTLPVQKATYSASFTALSPAASATDFFALTGATGKVISVKHVECWGVSTAASAQLLTALTRSTADSAGTAVAITPAKFDPNASTASATAAKYTANPTTGTLRGNLFSGYLSLNAAASPSINTIPLVWDFGLNNTQPIVLRKATDQFALNAGGASFGAGASVSCTVTWTEG